MLLQLSIRNLATITELNVEFDFGMTVLTGETGAGKSILIDALGLALGARIGSANTWTNNTNPTEIIASFDIHTNSEARDFLKATDLSTSDEECILRRIVGRDGRSRAYVNGLIAPLQTLRELSQLLVDIHGQYAQLSLLRTEGQRALLDSFAHHEPMLSELSVIYRQLSSIERELNTLQSHQDESETRLDFLRFQLQELREARVDDNEEFDRLDEEHRRLSHMTAIKATVEHIQSQLTGNEEATVCAVLQSASTELEALSLIDPRLQEAIELLNIASTNTQEASITLRRYFTQESADPATLECIDKRLSLLYKLARKHRVSPAKLSFRYIELEQEYSNIEGIKDRIAELHETREENQKTYDNLADKLHHSRMNAAKALGVLASEHLPHLGIQEGAISIDVIAEDSRTTHGRDRIELNVRTNPGHLFAPLSKIVSGGELSRIGLAVHVATASTANLPCLIFDEVDAGISGSTALEVGRRLSELATKRQVLCVTHLPQVAAHATHHFCVNKTLDKTGAATEITSVSNNSRIEELARMLGGEIESHQSLAHAQFLLDKGQTYASTKQQKN